MKKTLLLCSLLLFTCISLQAQVPKYVMLEHFSNTENAQCATKNPDFYNLIDANTNEVHHITFYPGVPEAACIFFNDNVVDNTQRKDYYGISAVPTVVAQGTEIPAATDLMTQTQLNPYLNQTTYLDFDIDIESMGVYQEVSVKVWTEAPIVGNTDALVLFAYLVEDTLNFNTSNGETIHYNVMRQKIYAPIFDNFIPAPPGNGVNYTSGFTPDPTWDMSRLHVIAYVQDTVTNEIIQSGASNDPEPLQVSIAQIVDETCSGSMDAAVFSDIMGGCAPYNCSWVDASGTVISNMCDLQNVPGGSYTLVVGDDCGNVESQGVNLNIPSPLFINSNVQNSEDTLDNGSITITIGGGSPPYDTDWTSVTDPYFGATNTTVLTNLPPGAYIINLSDNNGCMYTDTITVFQEFGNLDCSYVATEPLCFNEQTGSIDVTVLNAVPPVIFNWDDGFVVEDPVNLAAGVYVVTISDALNQQCVLSCVVTEPDPVLVSVITEPDNDNSCDGTAQLAVTGGSPPFIYEWSTGETDLSIDSLCAGDYWGQATDINGCVGVDSFAIAQSSTFLSIFEDEFNSISCFGEVDGSIQTTITGGTPPYSFTWDPPGLSATEDAVDLDVGTYTLTVTDAAMTSEMMTWTVVEPEELIITDIITTPVVSDDSGIICSGTAWGQYTGGTPPIDFQWNIGQTDSIATGLSDGVFNLTIVDANLCTATQQFLIGTSTDASDCVTSILPINETNVVIMVYPNPTIENAFVRVDLPESVEMVYSVYNSDGRLVFEIEETFIAGTNELELDVKNWPRGTYYVQMSSEKFYGSEVLILSE